MSATEERGSPPAVPVLSGAEAGEPRLSLHLAKALGSEEEVSVLVKVSPPTSDHRSPVDICCVIDVSGSMGLEATIQGSGGHTESHGLSLLDVAKHGVRTVMMTLGAEDRLSLVTFNWGAELIFPLTSMDEDGQRRLGEVLNRVEEGGGTNIWDGLRLGLQTLQSSTAERFGHVMLLTDGQTDDRDELMPSFRKYREEHERLPGTVSTFGFGYNIDSELIVDIAKYGGGTYSFIPDAGFVGTVFVNTLSNLLVTMAREVFVDLEAESGASIVRALGAVPLERSGSDGERVRLSLSTLQYGQSKDVVLAVKAKSRPSADSFLVASLVYETPDRRRVTCGPCEVKTDAAAELEVVEPQLLRSLYIESVTEAFTHALKGHVDDAVKRIRDLAERLRSSPSASDDFVAALLEDVNGQTMEAVSRNDWFMKWGKHYLPSIRFAHEVQQCNNFKDPSVQLYGSELFKRIQEIADDVFNSLPAPKKNAPDLSWMANIPDAAPPTSAPAAPTLTSMAAYNDRYGVCIAADCHARLASGEDRCVGDLRKGDVVEGPGGKTAEVLCLVRTECAGGAALLSELPGGARLTPYHPVLLDGEWRFPADIAVPKERPCAAVCSVVLAGAAALLVEGVPCAALGHCIEEGAARHAYFGTSRVLEDLKGAPGFSAGLVELPAGSAVRDPETGLVCGLRF